MRHRVRRSNCESSIQDSCEKGNATTPASLVLEVLPHERTCSVLFGHCRNNNDRDQSARDNQKQSDRLQRREQSVAENDECGAKPSNQDEGDVRVPWLDDEAWMKHRVHLGRNVGRDRYD